MSSWVTIDHPEEVVHWFPDYPPAERERHPIGDCPHECGHHIRATVAWGPDLAHYELQVCNDDGCAGNCRGWIAVDDNAHGGEHGPKASRSRTNPPLKLLS